MYSTSLNSKTAIVTGAGKGMGREIALTLSDAGANLAVTDIDENSLQSVKEELQQNGKSNVIAIKADVTNENDANALVNSTINEFGNLDILVNNAGVSSAVNFSEISEREWDRIFDINVKGVFLCSKAAVPHMVKRRSGKIINISSMVAKEAIPLFVHYSASKFAVLGMTQGLAKEVAEYNINVNAVCPGVVRTPLWEPLLKQLSKERSISSEEAFLDFTKDIPLQRPQEPKDIANMVLYLSSDLSKNITGQGINISGGMQLQ
ncbi:SDR family NAD(P)-dependent oxidoreductase [Alteribacillus sp. YIM 98480]|uniref:SDR family NAD(P)-dependent oxidoreductase n=1 Tax=Alteribacillus sp. YIM 98480 TaxID=2606599 RepID=UPI00131C413B|nr:SDR family NAD(P)-dependent oxidoreductase [Alteribacillus sp. YIM 98480]